MEIREIIEKTGTIKKLTISKPKKDAEYKKITVTYTDKDYIAECFTQKQAFHKHIPHKDISIFVEEMTQSYLQLNIWDESAEHIVLISKKGHITYKRRVTVCASERVTHNRKKQYLIEEGTVVPPLVDMGIFTSEGKIVSKMYDKFRQINRFIELIDDEIRDRKYEEINIIDFGCGKSYLTFILYYYLTKLRGIKANIVGLDLKADVIENCNKAAKKYGYSGLRFEMGDINGYKCKERPHMVITLHACDTATDYALQNAVEWDAEMIFSVPCCQHEVNGQIKSDNLSALTRYGIIKERASALITDAIRADMLCYRGYRTQVLEFVDLSHTPKNVLIRAVKSNVSEKSKRMYLNEVERMIAEFDISPSIYNLLK